ncbi:hypothetical protein GKIL_4133 [Gloeobacter kilaueensis JS1]|uniref:Uncharacterized protein n=1 Tax=Gloeobacter kilaueensis (strain ATCC BAA-2537 / CCAP 1431/1 / ULC 316 / JS1) TaxID=1183438 RepID=U5QRY4_GLOK1|nr:hypothetical protein GKIL_4133 [Gloeobacter kilaueensis JS1]
MSDIWARGCSVNVICLIDSVYLVMRRLYLLNYSRQDSLLRNS